MMCSLTSLMMFLILLVVLSDAALYTSKVVYSQAGCTGTPTSVLIGVGCTSNSSTCTGNTLTYCNSSYFDIPSTLAQIFTYGSPTCDPAMLTAIEGITANGACLQGGPSSSSSYSCDSNGGVVIKNYGAQFCAGGANTVTLTTQCNNGKRGTCTPTGGGGGGSTASALAASALLLLLLLLL